MTIIVYKVGTVRILFNTRSSLAHGPSSNCNLHLVSWDVFEGWVGLLTFTKHSTDDWVVDMEICFVGFLFKCADPQPVLTCEKQKSL